MAQGRDDHHGHGHERHDHDGHGHEGHGDPGHRHPGRAPGNRDRHGHSHGDGHGHSHAVAVTGDNERRLRLVLAMTAGYALVQAAGGLLAGSLALVADAGHMVSDAAALFLALVAYRVARRAPTPQVSYGFHRVRVLAALANGASLLLLVGWILWEAVSRLGDPVEVLAGPMLAVAVVGLGVNIAGFAVLRTGDRGDGNLRGALLHVAGDLLGSVGAIAAALGIMATGWNVLDPILSVLVAALVVRSAWSLVADSVLVLIQAAPAGVDPAAVLADIATLPGVAEARHLHVWTLADDRAVATIHVVPAPGVDPLVLPRVVAARLADRHGIAHATVEVNAPGEIPEES